MKISELQEKLEYFSNVYGDIEIKLDASDYTGIGYSEILLSYVHPFDVVVLCRK